MIRTLKIPVYTLWVTILVLGPAWAQETTTVTAEGVADIQNNRVDIARTSALEDAQKRAVEQVIGTMVDPQTRIEHYQLISDRILSRNKSYIRRYHVIGETIDSGLLRVRIGAEVSLRQLSNDMTSIGIASGQIQEPGDTRSVNITILGLNKMQFVKFKDVLSKQVICIKNVHERSFKESTARITVESTVSIQKLSDIIAHSDFGTFDVEVTGSTANSLELRVTPK